MYPFIDLSIYIYRQICYSSLSQKVEYSLLNCRNIKCSAETINVHCRYLDIPHRRCNFCEFVFKTPPVRPQHPAETTNFYQPPEVAAWPKLPKCKNEKRIRFLFFLLHFWKRKTKTEFVFCFSFPNLKTKNEKGISFSFFVRPFENEKRKDRTRPYILASWFDLFQTRSLEDTFETH